MENKTYLFFCSDDTAWVTDFKNEPVIRYDVDKIGYCSINGRLVALETYY